MNSLVENSMDEKYYGTIIIASNLLKNSERSDLIIRVSGINPYLGAKCIMSCEKDEILEKKVAKIAEAAAIDYENATRSSNGFLALVELNNFDIFKNIVTDLDHYFLKNITLILKNLVNSIDANQILKIVESIIGLNYSKKGVEPKILLDIMKFVIISNIDFNFNQIEQMYQLYVVNNYTLRLSQIASFLKSTKEVINDFLLSRNVVLKSGKNPEINYAYLSYFIGEQDVIDKDKILFGDPNSNEISEVPVYKSTMIKVFDILRQNFDINDIVTKENLVGLILPLLPPNERNRGSAFVSILKQMGVVKFEKVIKNSDGTNIPFYKILDFSNLNRYRFKEEPNKIQSKDRVNNRPIKMAANGFNNYNSSYLNKKKSDKSKMRKNEKKEEKVTKVSEFGEKILLAMGKKIDQ